MKQNSMVELIGCHICCPFYTKSTWVLDKYWYKNQFDRFHKIIEDDFITRNKWIRMNCTLSEYHLNWNGGVVRDEPNEEVINEYAKYNNIDSTVAKQYFNKYCASCPKPKK